MQEQHLNLARIYERLDIKVHYSSWSEEAPRSAYGPMKRSISAAAGFVINGGAIIPREATPYWRGLSGGDKAWEEVEKFFSKLRANARS